MGSAPAFALAHVALPSHRFEQSQAFYELLGGVPGFVRRAGDGTPLLLQMRLGDGFVELIRPPPGQGPAPAGHIAFRTDDIDAAWNLLRQHGYTPSAPPRRGVSGVMWFFVDDPSGNAVEITAPISADQQR